MKRSTKKALTVFGILGVAGGIAYWLSRPASGTAPAISATPATPLPPAQTPLDLKAVAQRAHDALAAYERQLAANPPRDSATLAAAQAKLEQLRVAYRDAAGRAGMQVTV